MNHEKNNLKNGSRHISSIFLLQWVFPSMHPIELVQVNNSIFNLSICFFLHFFSWSIYIYVKNMEKWNLKKKGVQWTSEVQFIEFFFGFYLIAKCLYWLVLTFWSKWIQLYGKYILKKLPNRIVWSSLYAFAQFWVLL